MLEKWGYFGTSGFNGTSWPNTGNCLIEVYDADLDVNPGTIGWSVSGTDRECLLEGRTLIEDIE